MSERDVKRKKSSKRRRRKKLLLTFLLILAVGLLCGLSLTVFFPVKHIQITGGSYYNAEQVAQAAGLKTSDNLLRLSEDKILENIQRELPFVDSIEIKRKFPDTVVINVSDAEEFYCYKIDNIYYSADKKGRVLKEYTQQPAELLYIECTVTLSESGVQSIVYESEHIKEIIDLISKESDKFPVKADYIDLSDLYEIKMGFDSRFTVELGEAVNLAEKFALLYEMMETKGEQESGTFKLDMWSVENPKGSYFKNE